MAEDEEMPSAIEAENEDSANDDDDDDSSASEAELDQPVEKENAIDAPILEGDASEICRQKPSTDGVDDIEQPAKKRRIQDDDDDDFFQEFIDDDTAYENVDESQVWLDAYNADLNMKIFPDNRLMAEPLHEDGFAYMTAGVRASYGVNRGRIGFEVKVLDNLDISQVRPEETHTPHELRIGWSTDTASLQLGESHYGYGYCSSTGRKVVQWRFASYAEPFDVGDVVAGLVDFEKKEIQFSKNGQLLGVAFTLGEEWESEQLGPPLFPHVASKNVKFEANFGQQNTPWCGLPDGYTFINALPLNERIRGPVPPKSKRDCTALMTVGLPASGKSTWVEKFCQQNQDQRWHVLSAPTVLEHMKVQGVSRKKLTQGRWDVMMGATVKCLNKLMTLACRKKKNYIIDQTNCYPLARKKKITAFKDFYKKAVVIIPTVEAHADRLLRQAMLEGKQMPPEAMLEMKACFTLPKEDEDLFDEIVFIELDREEAQRIVEHYNEEGKAFKPPEPKKRRGSDWQQDDLSTASPPKKALYPTTSNGTQSSGHAGDVSGSPQAVSGRQSGWQTGRQEASTSSTADQPSYYQSYHHAYRTYHTFTPRSGWPSNWPQAQWAAQQNSPSALSPALSDASAPAYPGSISAPNTQSPQQFVYPSGHGDPGTPTPNSTQSDEPASASPSIS